MSEIGACFSDPLPAIVQPSTRIKPILPAMVQLSTRMPALRASCKSNCWAKREGRKVRWELGWSEATLHTPTKISLKVILGYLKWFLVSLYLIQNTWDKLYFRKGLEFQAYFRHYTHCDEGIILSPARPDELVMARGSLSHWLPQLAAKHRLIIENLTGEEKWDNSPSVRRTDYIRLYLFHDLGLFQCVLMVVGMVTMLQGNLSWMFPPIVLINVIETLAYVEGQEENVDILKNS